MLMCTYVCMYICMCASVRVCRCVYAGVESSVHLFRTPPVTNDSRIRQADAAFEMGKQISWMRGLFMVP